MLEPQAFVYNVNALDRAIFIRPGGVFGIIYALRRFDHLTC